MPIPEAFLAKQRLIGSRLIDIESQNPGLIRIVANPFMIPAAAQDLKNLGFKKSFLQSSEQFVVSCFLHHHQAVNALLPLTLFAGSDLGDGKIHCWNGCGQYAGWQGLFQLTDFAAGNKQNRCLLIVNAEPFFDKIRDTLDPIPSN